MGAGFQFIHVGAFSRKGNKQGQSTDFIFGEVERRPDASLHVSNPSPPEVVFGLAVSEVRALHDERAAHAKDVMKNGRTRAIRSTQQTLATVIASHPFTVAEARADPAKAAEVSDWEHRTVEWLKNQFGSQLVSVVRHTDERHCHLHCYILPDNSMMKAAAIHPGHVAKSAVIAEGPQPGEDEKTLNKRADRSYRTAMRKWQDDYYQHVGAPSGLTRIGPQVRRLKRAEWQAETQAAQALKNSLARAEYVDAKRDEFLKQTKQEASRFVERTQKEARETLDRAIQEAGALRAAADREKDAADKSKAAALAAQEQAQKAQERASEAISHASRYSGLSGRLRAVWDGLRKSKIAASIRQEFSGEIEHAKAFAKTVQDRLKAEERRRHEAERKAHEAQQDAERARNAAVRMQIERDRAWSLLPTERKQELAAAGPSMKMTLRPEQKREGN